ncbi:dITP/XTP pyrophosphatase [Legionella sainthelensi]|nr:dITP/XTP pyrophosphatase [Legionella sainthelensi]
MIPYFIFLNINATMAQLPAKLKNNISHRAQALKQLRNSIQNL